MKMRNIEKVVEELLINCPDTRGSDKILYIRFIDKEGYNINLPFENGQSVIILAMTVLVVLEGKSKLEIKP